MSIEYGLTDDCIGDTIKCIKNDTFGGDMDYWIKDKDILLEGQIRKISDEFVDELILCRKSKKLTQQDIADRSGMKRENISRIENKKNTPTIDVLYKYAECLGMKMQIRLVDSETNLDKMEEKSGR